MGRLKSIAVDLSPLRDSRDFRLLWLTLVVSETGTQITLVAVFIQVYKLTHSAASVGLVGLFKLIPLLVTSIAGGSIIDAVDRRRLLIVTQCGLFGCSSLLLWGALLGNPPLYLIYGVVALQSVFHGFDSPTRSAMTPNLVSKNKLSSALALKQVAWNTTGLVGPAIAGVIIANLGLKWAYGIDVTSYLFGIGATMMLAPMRAEVIDGEITTGFAAIKEGLRYLKRQRIILSTFLVDLMAMVFGMPRALFPILAVVQFHKGPAAVGFLFAAPAAGALIASATSGWVGRVHRQGLAVMLAVSVWGLGITAFGLVGNHFWIALVLLAIAGAADVISAVFRSTIMQLGVPDSLRGRLSAVFILVVAGGPRLGDFEAGLVAAMFNPMISVVSGGLMCLVGVAITGLIVPEFVRYRVETSDLQAT